MLIFPFGSAVCKQEMLKKLMKHSKTLLTIYISIFASYNVLEFVNYFCRFITLFTFLGFILQLFVFMSSTIYDWLVKLLLYLFLSCSPVLRKITINLCEKDIFKKLSIKLSTVLNEYIFSYKWSIIQFYYLNHFLSHEF